MNERRPYLPPTVRPYVEELEMRAEEAELLEIAVRGAYDEVKDKGPRAARARTILRGALEAVRLMRL